jgi:hypothetical protein
LAEDIVSKNAEKAGRSTNTILHYSKNYYLLCLKLNKRLIKILLYSQVLKPIIETYGKH